MLNFPGVRLNVTCNRRNGSPPAASMRVLLHSRQAIQRRFAADREIPHLNGAVLADPSKRGASIRIQLSPPWIFA